MTSPIVIAVIASVVTIALYYACGFIGNKYAKGGAQLATVVFGLFLAGAISPDNTVAAMSGQYFFYIVVASAILVKIIGKKKKTEESKA